MRVLMYEPTGGFWPYVDDISEYIAQAGVEVTLLTSQLKETIVQKENRSYKMAALTRPMNSSFFPNKRNPWLKAFWAIDRFSSAIQWIMSRAAVARSICPDIIHIQSTIPVLDQFFLPKFARFYPVVLTVHDVLPISTTRAYGSKRVLFRIYHSVHHLIVHSESCRDELIQLFGIKPNKVSVVPHGVKEEKKKISKKEARLIIGIPPDSQVILCFGGIRKSKGLDIAIRTIAEVIKEHPKARLVIAGSPPRDLSLEEYKKISFELKIDSKIDWRIGYIPEEMVPYYFGAADIVLLPYTIFHSQSGVLLQSYRFGVPVVVTDVGALGETVRSDKVGIVVKQADPVMLAKAIGKLLNNPEMQEQCINNELIAVAQKYKWEKVAEQTIQIYKQLMTK